MRRRFVVAGIGVIGTLALAAGAVCLTSGCSTIGYYGQAIGGHLELLQRARPVDEWLHEPATPPRLRERLALSQRIRDFAVSELALPDNRSYRSYADLQRGAAVWNVVAAPELSLKLKTWCFPVMGCVSYRGYFGRDEAEALAAELRREGLEVTVYGVPAYSTLGWTNWIGGDPLLNTFLGWPEGELARVVFHELAHQVAYAADDTTFNESFATAVEAVGTRRWLQTHAGEAVREEYASFDGRRRDFREFALRWRGRFDELYKSDADDAAKRARKAELMAAMRAEYEVMKRERWGGFAGYDAWFARANNASLGVLAAYNELVPAFEKLLEREGGDMKRFYAEVKRLAALPRGERRATLDALVR